MRLSFIGMSGTGKSHWSSQLVERGFTRFCCDYLIAERLKPEVASLNGTKHSLAEWMGFPYEAHFAEREAQYLATEIEVLDEILSYLEALPVDSPENIIVDSTGSVIYTGQAMLERLHRQTTMIYLDTPLAVQERMHAIYLTNPAPVLWQGHFNRQPGESNAAALARCYPELLTSRTHEYKQWAEISLDYHLLRQPGFTVDDFLAEINSRIHPATP
jgi:shikimate kinase